MLFIRIQIVYYLYDLDKNMRLMKKMKFESKLGLLCAGRAPCSMHHCNEKKICLLSFMKVKL